MRTRNQTAAFMAWALFFACSGLHAGETEAADTETHADAPGGGDQPAGAEGSACMRPPNILLITDDQHRFDFVEGGCIPGLRTPAIARLRREGTTLTHAYSACPLCVPTRFTWWYGLRASQASGAWGDFDGQWPQHLPSVGHALQGAGYRTAVIGKGPFDRQAETNEPATG